MTQTQIKVPYAENYDFGIGVDLATGSPMGKVVDGGVTGVQGAGGAKTSFSISRIHTTSELETKLSIDVEASGGCGCFGASARFNFAKESKVQESSLFMAITSYIVLENLSIDDPTLSSHAAQIAGRDDAFSTRYGNMFVRGMGRGGLFVGVIQINTAQSEESDSVSAELGGSYGLFSAEAKTKLENVAKKYRNEINITVYHEGGPIDLSMDDMTDPNQLYSMLQQWLKAFQDDPERNAVPYSVTLAPIAIANGPIPPNAADIQHAQDILVICAKQRSVLLDGLNLMDFIAHNPSRYDFAAPTTPADIAKAFAGYQFDLGLVGKAASYAIDHVTEAMTPAEYALRIAKQPYPQGIPPTPMPTMQKGRTDILAARGEVLANEDPLAMELRDREPIGPSRRGFFIGMGAAEGQTLPGPGKDKFGAELPDAEQAGYSRGVRFSVDRNRNFDVAARGAAIARAVPAVAQARTTNPSVFYWLGFDIATGLFGDPALGGLGQTAWGPGKQKIYDSLGDDEKLGFDASKKLHLGPPPLPRQG